MSEGFKTTINVMINGLTVGMIVVLLGISTETKDIANLLIANTPILSKFNYLEHSIKVVITTFIVGLLHSLTLRIRNQAERKMLALIPNNEIKEIAYNIQELEKKLVATPMRLLPTQLDRNLKVALANEAEYMCDYLQELSLHHRTEIRSSLAFEITDKLFSNGQNFKNIKVLDQTFERWRKEYKNKYIALPVYWNLFRSVCTMSKEKRCDEFMRLFIIDDLIKEECFSSINDERKIINLSIREELFALTPKNVITKIVNKEVDFSLEEFILARIKYEENQFSGNIETRVVFMSIENANYKKVINAKDFIIFDDNFMIEESVTYQLDTPGISSLDVSKNKILNNSNLFNVLLNSSYTLKL